jgi:hypothetical protein
VTPVDPTVWTRRYEEALAPGVIKARGESRAKAIEGLLAMDVEEACNGIRAGMEAVLLVTAQTEGILRTLIQRALAHAKVVYSNPRNVLVAAYKGVAIQDFVTPMFLTGLAGVGKSRLRVLLQRVLAGRTTIYIDASHPAVPLIDFIDGNVGRKASASAVIAGLTANIADGAYWHGAGDVVENSARLIRVSGACLLGVDEMQFMAQSTQATALITRTLLNLADLQVPWFVTGNYSLGWKLRQRPSEATQRLLAEPVVLLPDPWDSEDWGDLLSEYQVVLRDGVGFSLLDRRRELWNRCAGLKRELIKLLVHSYRLARQAGAPQLSWAHVDLSFASLQFSVSRDDINALIAHAGQGGKLKKDLSCPFHGPEIERGLGAFSAKLREARTERVAQAAVEAAMTSAERRAFENIKSAANEAPAPQGQVIKLPQRRKPRTLESLQDAGYDLLASLSPDAPTDPSPTLS